jgi:tetratricopeptide (TPR) repeat protein
MLLEKYPQSYAAFERALALAPSYPPIYRAYGRSLLAGGRYEEAISRFQQYVDLAPPYWKMKEPYARGELPAWEKSRFEVFYKQNPSFDEVFTSIEEAKIKLKSD